MSIIEICVMEVLWYNFFSMKVVASNNTIRLLSIFFFILLFSGISLLYKDVISNGIKYGRWFTLDRYEEMLEDCDHIKMGGG